MNAQSEPNATPEPQTAAVPTPPPGTTFTKKAPPGAAPPGAQDDAATTRPDSATDGIGSLVIPANTASPLRHKKMVVVGFGALGSHIALSLALEGVELHIIDDCRLNTYFAAAGWIAPYHATDPRAGNWGLQSIEVWNALGEKFFPEGYVQEELTMFERTRRAPRYPAEFAGLPGFRPVAKLGDGIAEAFTARTLVAPAELWHPFIRNLLAGMDNVTFHFRHVRDAAEMESLAAEFGADMVVDCIGVNEFEMYPDRMSDLMYGLVAHMKMPEGWHGGIRSRNTGIPHPGFSLPGGSADPYLITQRSLRRIVVGGCMLPMTPAQTRALIESGYAVDEVLADEVITRAQKHFPALRDLEVERLICSVRPCRDRFKLEFDHHPRLLHVGGFGGSGITLAPVIARNITTRAIDLLGDRGGGC